jgi:hypothetical protein
MAADSADPLPPERAQVQRYGMVELLRMRKDDGRSLILYSHDEPGPDTWPEAQTAERGRA